MSQSTIETAARATAKLGAGANIDAGELAALLGINHRTVATYARTGRWPSQRIGASRRFSPEHVASIRALADVPANMTPPVGA